jgi:hypothetical protein
VPLIDARVKGWSNEELSGNPFLPEQPPVLLPLDHNVARFPILAMLPTSREVQPLANRIPESERSSLKLSALGNKYRLAVPFRACRAGTDDCKEASVLEKVRVGAGEGDVLPTQSLATALSLPFWERLRILSLNMRVIAKLFAATT